MDKVNKKSRVILIIVFCLLVVCGFIIVNLREEKTEKNIKVNDDKYILLDDYSRFFTVNSCVYKYVQYLQSRDIDSLLLVLDKDYVKDKQINRNNIFNFLPDLSNGMYTFTSKKIYFEKINDNYISYYVYGFVAQELMDEVGAKTEYYFKVNLDLNNETFSISPYDGKIFKEEL